MHDVLCSQGAGAEGGDPYSAEKQYEIQQKSQAYLSGTLEDIE